MGVEIERKFLVRGESWREQAKEGVGLRQGYLQGAGQASVRVRQEGARAYLNIKSLTLGVRRLEFEYEIPMADAQQLLDALCVKPLIEKTRYHVHCDEHVWEVDVFDGENAGLVVAEIELQDESEAFTRPDWIGEEVSDDVRYYNVNLVEHPFKSWT